MFSSKEKEKKTQKFIPPPQLGVKSSEYPMHVFTASRRSVVY